MSNYNIHSALKFSSVISDLKKLGHLVRDGNGRVDIESSLNRFNQYVKEVNSQYKDFVDNVVEVSEQLFKESNQHMVGLNVLVSNVSVKICGMSETRFGKIQRQVRNAILSSPRFYISNGADGVFVRLCDHYEDEVQSIVPITDRLK